MPPTEAREVKCLISAEQVAARVRELAQQITADCTGKELLAVGVLKGAFVFMADLVRHLTIPVRCDFVKVSSYGTGTETTGKMQLHLDLSLPAQGQHVLLVEDIIDTGLAAHWLLKHLQQKEPASVRLCALLDKPVRRRVPVPIDYLGFTVPDRFIVGYGIDCGERHRELPYVGYVPTGEESDGHESKRSG